jgi:hypothetical protein
MADFSPVSFLRHKESVLIRARELRGDEILRHALGTQVLAKLLAFLIEQIAQPLQEEHAEDVFLVLGGVHVAAQVVTGAEQQARKLRECKFSHRQS